MKTKVNSQPDKIMKENKGNYPAFPNQGFISNNGAVDFAWNGYGMGGLSARDYMAIEIMKGMCAAESDEFGFGDKYMGLDGKETSRRIMYELTDGKEDYNKKQVNLKISRTKHQQEVEEAYQRADALLEHSTR